MTKKAILYARVSTDEQKEKGVSLDDQLEKCNAYAVLNDMQVVGKFMDNFTGTKIDRPDFIKAREMLRTGKANAIICYDSDRLTRNPTDYVLLRDELLKLGVELHYVTRGYINLDDFGQMAMEDIQGRFARQWLKKIREGMDNGKNQKIKQGSVMVHQQPPYGYKTIKEGKLHKLEIYEEEAKIVRLIFRLYVYGDDGKWFTMNQIANRLNEMGIEPHHDKRPTVKTPKSRQWKGIMISRLISRETYAGVWHWKPETGEHLTVKVPAIIDRQTWEKAQELKSKNKQGRTKEHRYNALLRQRVTCGECGYKMGVNSFKDGKRVHIYYKCSCAKRKNPQYSGRTCTNAAGFPVAKTDKQLWEQVKALLTDKERFRKELIKYNERSNEQSASLENDVALVESSLQRKTQELAKAVDALIMLDDSEADITKGMLRQRTQEIEQSISELQERKAKLTAKLEKQRLSKERMQSLEITAMKIGKGILKADGNFEAQKDIFDILNVQVTLSVVNGEKKVSATCELGPLDAYEPCNTGQQW
jgi:site-specific DNA recombinase